MGLRPGVRSGLRRAGRLAGAPFRAAWRFGGWVRHSTADTEAVYGTNPNDLPPEGRVTKAAIIAHGLGGGGGGAGGMQ